MIREKVASEIQQVVTKRVRQQSKKEKCKKDPKIPTSIQKTPENPDTPGCKVLNFPNQKAVGRIGSGNDASRSKSNDAEARTVEQMLLHWRYR